MLGRDARGLPDSVLLEPHVGEVANTEHRLNLRPEDFQKHIRNPAQHDLTGTRDMVEGAGIPRQTVKERTIYQSKALSNE